MFAWSPPFRKQRKRAENCQLMRVRRSRPEVYEVQLGVKDFALNKRGENSQKLQEHGEQDRLAEWYSRLTAPL